MNVSFTFIPIILKIIKIKLNKKNMKHLKKILIFISLLVILFSSLVSLYGDRAKILKIVKNTITPIHSDPLVNPLNKSLGQIPPDNISDLIIYDDADLKGQWSAPFDWNVTAIHSVLLPDSNVMTFGTFAISEKENIDIRENKVITLTDGREFQRDVGLNQWMHHDVNSGIDFDIWNVAEGFSESAHQLFLKPVFMDAFCSVVRVIDSDRVFILGGNENIERGMPDTQKSTMIYNVKEKTFELSESLNFKRWYASVVRTGDNKLVIMGGRDAHKNDLDDYSRTPEIIDLDNINDGWKILNKAESNEFFGNDPFDSNNFKEWSYPRAFLASDGNIVGISYNKLWVMDKSDDYRIKATGEIPLAKSGISKILEHKNLNTNQEFDHKLKLLTISSPVGISNSVVMIEKDKVILFGGKQPGDEYSPSNQVIQIDFSDTSFPIIEELGSMSYARSDGNATILPTGEVFLNGGHAFDDLHFSNFTPEIYNPINSTSVELSNSYFRRNYHASSLLLPDGTILTAGGDVWNAEIFYPPYLFTKDWDNNTILAKRPKILDLDIEINRGKSVINILSEEVVNKVTLISTGSVTHAQGSESKFTTLEFSKLNSDQLQIEIPEDRNEIQSGTYMLFLINSSGVPSHGEIVNIN